MLYFLCRASIMLYNFQSSVKIYNIRQIGWRQPRGGTPPAYSILTITVVSSTKTKIDISVLKSYSVYG